LKTVTRIASSPIWIGQPEAAGDPDEAPGRDAAAADDPRPAHRGRRRAEGPGGQGHRHRAAREYVLRPHHHPPGRERARDRLAASDAIAIAVRCEAQIFAADDVVEESSIEFQAGEDEVSLVTASSLSDLDPEEFRRFIETVTPEEFATSLEEEFEDADEPDEDDDEDEDDAA
jgi:hypothetical protein